MQTVTLRGSRARWTSDEEQLLTSSLVAGRSIHEIAQIMGRSQGAVHSKSLALVAIPKRLRSEVRPRNCRRRSADFFLS